MARSGPVLAIVAALALAGIGAGAIANQAESHRREVH